VERVIDPSIGYQAIFGYVSTHSGSVIGAFSLHAKRDGAIGAEY